MIIALWVDDNKIAYSAPHMLDHFRKFLRKCGYEFRDYGEWKYSLGLDISYSRSEGRLPIAFEQVVLVCFLQGTHLQVHPSSPDAGSDWSEAQARGLYRREPLREQVLVVRAATSAAASERCRTSRTGPSAPSLPSPSA